jgi:hypothetical protein
MAADDADYADVNTRGLNIFMFHTRVAPKIRVIRVIRGE